jgi:hypothetical protein
VLAPLMWLLSDRHSMQRPRLHAWGLRLGEVALMVAMLGVLIGLPGAALAWGVIPTISEVLQRPDGEFVGDAARSSLDRRDHRPPGRSQPRNQPVAYSAPVDHGGQDPNVTASADPQPSEKARSSAGYLLRPDRFRASSTYRRRNEQYPPEQAFDGRLETAWAEGKRGPGQGEWIEAIFNSPQHIFRIELTTGYEKHHPRSGDLFFLNAHLRQVRVEFDRGRPITRDIDRAQRRLKISDLDITASRIRFIASKVWKGKRWQDLSISEISIFGESKLP